MHDNRAIYEYHIYKCFTKIESDFYNIIVKNMATVKAVVLRHQMKEDGTWNVKIRISQKGSSAYLQTPYFVPESLINKKDFTLKEKGNKIYDRVTVEVLKIREELVRIGRSVSLFTARDLADHMKAMLENKPIDVDFFDEGDRIIGEMTAEGRLRATTYKCMLNRFEAFLGSRRCPINDITSGMVLRFEDWLYTQKGIHSGRPLTGSGISGYMVIFSKIIKEAKRKYNDEDRGVLVVRCNPFVNYHMPKKNPVNHRALSPEQIRSIVTCKIPEHNLHMEMARDLYAVSFMLCGMNTVDLFKCAPAKNGRVEYNRSKTCKKRADGAFMSIEIQPELQPYLDRYKDPLKEHLLCFNNLYTNYSGFNLALNKQLKKIGELVGIENLTMYTARHSFATIARNDCGFSMEDVAMCLVHSCPFKITDVYVRQDWSRVDKVVRAVLDLVLKVP